MRRRRASALMSLISSMSAGRPGKRAATGEDIEKSALCLGRLLAGDSSRQTAYELRGSLGRTEATHWIILCLMSFDHFASPCWSSADNERAHRA